MTFFTETRKTFLISSSINFLRVYYIYNEHTGGGNNVRKEIKQICETEC